MGSSCRPNLVMMRLNLLDKVLLPMAPGLSDAVRSEYNSLLFTIWRLWCTK